MLLEERKELEDLLKTAGKTEEALAKEKLAELQEEAALDEKEVKSYLGEIFDEDSLEKMSWTEKLGWLVQGLYTDLGDLDLQAQLNSLKSSGQEEKIEELRGKKVETEKRRLEKEEERMKNQEAMGILPVGSLKQAKEMRDRSQEYAFSPESLDNDTKFKEFSEEQLVQKRNWLIDRVETREAELTELRDVSKVRQAANAKAVLNRITPGKYPGQV